MLHRAIFAYTSFVDRHLWALYSIVWMSKAFFLLLLFASPALEATATEDPRAWAVRQCAQAQVSDCACPEGCTPVQADFKGIGKYKICYRCAPSSDALAEFINQKPKAKCGETEILNQGQGAEWLGLPPQSTEVAQFPTGCGYNWKGFNADHFQETVNTLVSSDRVLCDSKHQSMCTSATFLYFIRRAKKWLESGRITQEVFNSWKSLSGHPWKLINGSARPDLLEKILISQDRKPLVKSLTILKSDMPNDQSLKPGDLLEFWRSSGFGHSVIFQGYLTDPKGKTIGLCFWSANVSTKGYGKKCEGFKNIISIAAARFDE